MDLSKIKYLACKGGGVRIAAYAGAGKYLEERGVLQNVRGVSGASAGAIYATLVCLGYTALEIQQIILDYNFKKFEDKTIGSILTSAKDYGYCKGDYFQNIIKKHIKEKLGSENATFRDLVSKKGKSLRVYSTILGTRYATHEFSFINTPNTPIHLAVRASMSIPGVYKAVKIGDKYHVDGGMVNNFPIHAFDEVANNDEVLGLYLYNKEEDEKIKNIGQWSPFKYSLMTFKALLKAQDELFFKDEEEVKRTILLDTLGVSSTNFNITKEEKLKLIKSGYDSAKMHF